MLTLRRDGTVVVTGLPTLFSFYPELIPPPGLSNVLQIASGNYHCLALKADGTVVSWGAGYSAPTNVPPEATNVVAITAGERSSTVLRADGTVVTWPCYASGYRPTCPLAGLTNVVAIGSGAFHGLALVAPGARVPMDALDTATLVWLTRGDAPWFAQTDVTHDHSDAAQSGAICDQQQSRLETTVTGPGTVSFWWRVSSEEGHDKLGFAIAGVERAAVSGQSGWEKRDFEVLPGPQTLAWTYAKDASGADGLDAAWLDEVIFIPAGTLAPSFTMPPTNQTVYRGASVTLSAKVLGIEPLHFQWLFNDTAIPGATNVTLTLSQAQPSEAGFYALIVSNAYGMENSSNAQLSVIDGPPRILRSPTNEVVNPTRTVAFGVVAVGTAPVDYQWRAGSFDIPRATNATLVLENVGYSQAGFYSVRVSNVFGAVTSGVARLSVVSTRGWGKNDHGQSEFPLGLTNAVALACGYSWNLALRADGTVASWGGGAFSATNVPRGFVQRGRNCGRIQPRPCPEKRRHRRRLGLQLRRSNQCARRPEQCRGARRRARPQHGGEG
jgi:hypothetical protein